jgi:hypothetical protein
LCISPVLSFKLIFRWLSAVAKDRQIIVRLSDPGVKFRILKCGKNLKQNPEYRHVDFIFELSVLFFEIVYFTTLFNKNKP